MKYLISLFRLHLKHTPGRRVNRYLRDTADLKGDQENKLKNWKYRQCKEPKKT